MENLVVDCLLVNLRTLCSVSIIEIISSLWTTECRDQYPNVCTLWYDFCDPDALKYKVLRQSVEFIKANCPVTCKKCQPGQRLLKSSRNLNGKWFFIFIFFEQALIWKHFYRRDIRMGQRNWSKSSWRTMRNQISNLYILLSGALPGNYKELVSEAIASCKAWIDFSFYYSLTERL